MSKGQSMSALRRERYALEGLACLRISDDKASPSSSQDQKRLHIASGLPILKQHSSGLHTADNSSNYPVITHPDKEWTKVNSNRKVRSNHGRPRPTAPTASGYQRPSHMQPLWANQPKLDNGNTIEVIPKMPLANLAASLAPSKIGSEPIKQLSPHIWKEKGIGIESTAIPIRPQRRKVPSPTVLYLDACAVQPSLLHQPQELLLILDLNGTLLVRKKLKFSPRIEMRDFVRHCLESYKVLIWSSARADTVSAICEQLFDPKNSKISGDNTQSEIPLKLENLIGVWDRTSLGLNDLEFQRKVPVYKQLTTVWSSDDIQRAHPEYLMGKRWDQTNTILIDDSPSKASAEPNNLACVPEFVKQSTDPVDVLKRLAEWLEGARMWNNVSAYIAQGNTPRFPHGKNPQKKCMFSWATEIQLKQPLCASANASNIDGSPRLKPGVDDE